MLTIASWNINSVRLRLPLVKRFTEEAQPDVLCLQETKTMDETFPADALREMGYAHQWFVGQKSYNGVCILSKVPLKNQSATPMIGRDDKRHIAAQLPDGTWLHNFYVPAGGDEPDTALNPKFDHKLRFVEAMTDWAKGLGANPEPTIILGDLNIAPLEHDVWSSKQLRNVVSHTAVERGLLEDFRASQHWLDAHRHFTPETEKLYSWWSYRSPNWETADRGRRLDHLWLTPGLKPRLKNARILKEARKWESPSDHVPILIQLEML